MNLSMRSTPGLLGVLLILATMLVACHSVQSQRQLPAQQLSGRQISPAGLLGRPGFSWRTHETKHLWLHYEANCYAEEQFELLATNQEAAMSRILDLLGERPLRRKVHVFAVENTNRMKALTGYDYTGLALPTEDSVCFVFSQTISGASAHELTHVVSQNIWGLL